MDYLEEQTGFVLKCDDRSLNVQNPTEFYKVGMVQLRETEFTPPNQDPAVISGSLLPLFDLYRDRCNVPNPSRMFKKWSGSNDDLSWCFAYDDERHELWFAIEYEDYAGESPSAK